MGCNIHMTVEEHDGERWVESAAVEPYEERHYGVYAILADVRNWPLPLTPIDRPRGLPEDPSDTARAAYARCGRDAHSASWYLLSELLDFDWEGTGHYQIGLANALGFREYCERGYADYLSLSKPERAEVVSQQEMQRLIVSGELTFSTWYDDFVARGEIDPLEPASEQAAENFELLKTMASWNFADGAERRVFVAQSVPYTAIATSFINWLTAAAAKVSDPARTRLVFFFDN
jgi:hypothetical protein